MLREYEYAKTFMRFYNSNTNSEKVNIYEILGVLETSFNKLHDLYEFHSISDLVVGKEVEMITYNTIYFEELYMDYMQEVYNNEDFAELTITYLLGDLELFKIGFCYDVETSTFAVSLFRTYEDECIYLYNVGEIKYRTYTDLPLNSVLKPDEICKMFLEHVLKDSLKNMESIKKTMKNLLKE